jgi:hypothetical protein
LTWDFPYLTPGYTTKPFNSTIISKSSSDYNNAKVFFTIFIASSAKIQNKATLSHSANQDKSGQKILGVFGS